MPASRINKSNLAFGVRQPLRRPDERKDKGYITLLHVLPCCVCGRPMHHAHHLMRVEPGSRGTALKNADRWAIPLCVDHHDEQFPDSIHHAFPGGEEAWLASKGIDGRALARTLYAAREDIEAMHRIIVRSLNARGVYIA